MNLPITRIKGGFSLICCNHPNTAIVSPISWVNFRFAFEVRNTICEILLEVWPYQLNWWKQKINLWITNWSFVTVFASLANLMRNNCSGIWVICVQLVAVGRQKLCKWPLIWLFLHQMVGTSPLVIIQVANKAFVNNARLIFHLVRFSFFLLFWWLYFCGAILSFSWCNFSFPLFHIH